jgi:tRNA dimethylallyltransferase
MKKVIIILGPTGVGKTKASILLAKHLKTEIISSDSMQIYRHMDIGTAKPSKEERQIVKHHVIDIVEPWELYSTGEYIKTVMPIIDSLHKNRKVPIIVGGTGLYIKAMTRGIFSGSFIDLAADWDLRNELLKREEKFSGYLYEYLKSLDPTAASKIMPSDTRRIVRALEVCLKSNTTISEMHRELTKPLPYEYIKIGIMRDRKELYKIIEQRVDKMIEQGLVDEVGQVLKIINEHFHHSITPLLHHSNLSSMQAIGYKEITMYLNGEISLENAVALVKKRSRNYAKRQWTWFKKEEGIKWIDVTGIHEPFDIFKAVVQRITN